MSDPDPHEVQRHLGRKKSGPKRTKRKISAEAKPLFPPRRVIDKFRLFSECGYQMTPPQELVHRAGPHDAGGYRYRIISAGVRTGKTHSGAWEIVAASLAPNAYPTTWWCCAPLHSLAERAFSMVCSIYTTHLSEHVVRLAQHDGVLTVRNLAGVESTVHRKSTERPTGLVGASVSGMLLDESSAIATSVWQSQLSTRLVDEKGWVLAISSPRGTSGWWPKMLREGLREESEEIFGVILPTHSNPRLDPQEILKAKSRLPENIFRQEYLGELVAAAGKVFCPESVEAAAVVPSFEAPKPGSIYVAGCDVSMAQGGDATVLLIAEKLIDGRARVVFADRWSKLDFDLMLDRIRRHLTRYNDAVCSVDATGLGAPIVQMMRSAGLMVRPTVFSARRKVELARNAQALLEKGLVTIPRREVFDSLVDEIETYEYVSGEDGASLPKMAAPAGHHDDCVAAFMLLCSHLRAGGGANRFHHRTTPGIATPTRREATEAAPFEQPEPIHYGGFYNPKTGQRLSQPTPRAHTPRRRGGSLGRSLFRDR